MSSAAKGERTREQVLQAITEYINKHQYSPSMREISEIVGLKSPASVFHHIEVLKEQGLVETDGDKQNKRALRVPRRMDEYDSLYLAKCKEVNRLEEQIKELQEELNRYKVGVKYGLY